MTGRVGRDADNARTRKPRRNEEPHVSVSAWLGRSEVELDAELQQPAHERAGRTEPRAAGRAAVARCVAEHRPRVEGVEDVEDPLHLLRATELDHLDEPDVRL